MAKKKAGGMSMGKGEKSEAKMPMKSGKMPMKGGGGKKGKKAC